MKLAVFDFDSTLMDGETIDFLAAELGLEEEVAHITKKAMEGELDFFKSLVARVALLEGLPVVRVDEICRSLPLVEGAKETVGALKEMGFKVVCFSGGFRNATAPISKYLGIDADFANYLHQEDGILTGRVGGEMMFGDSKGKMLVRLQRLLDIDSSKTLVVGDGANDLSMFSHAKYRVAFCAKEVLKEAANYVVDKKDLREVIKVANEV
ncbi:MAG: phosphoserine phosphatase SerB [Epsilonproteobacteria bacterium]|nr:phosphoserine phosphatase SerB [Campylobacterota bacterium]